MKYSLAVLLIFIGLSCIALGVYSHLHKADGAPATPVATPGKPSQRIGCVRARSDITVFFRPLRQQSKIVDWKQIAYRSAIPAGHYGLSIVDESAPASTPDQIRSFAKVVWATDDDPLLIKAPSRSKHEQWILTNLLEPVDCNSIPAPTPTPEPTLPPTPEPTPTPEPSPSGYIASLSARVTSLKFFESSKGAFPVRARMYTNRFDRSQTRNISWELSLMYPPKGSRVNCVITAIIHRPDGTALTKQVSDIYIEPNWADSMHGSGWGESELGGWQVGVYRVDLLVEGQRVASNTFEVY